MGIAALAIIFRYIFIGLGFDFFGANLVFIITFIVGLVFFVSYLEFIQRVIPPIFKKKQTTKLANHLTKQVSNDLDDIRKIHEQKELERKEELLETALQYTRATFVPYATDENINRLCEYIIDYYKGIAIKNVRPVTVKDLSSFDLYHFGWNIWNHFKPVRRNKQEDIAIFLKFVFAHTLKDVETETIKKKLTFNEGKCEIKLEKEKIYISL